MYFLKHKIGSAVDSAQETTVLDIGGPVAAGAGMPAPVWCFRGHHRPVATQNCMFHTQIQGGTEATLVSTRSPHSGDGHADDREEHTATVQQLRGSRVTENRNL